MQRKPKIAPLVADTEQIAGNTAAPSSASEGSGGGGKAFVTAVIAIVALAVAGFAYYKFRSAPKGPYFENASVDRLTQSGSAAVVAISPDGQMIAYALRNGAEQSVMVRQVRTGNDAQLIAPAKVMYSGFTFSPDGNYLYYTASSKDNQLYSSLYRLPANGGQATQIVEDIDTAISFSPNGKQFAFVRGVPQKRENDLVVANSDGSDVKVVAKRPGQVYAASLIAPAWSPDGKTILFTNYGTTNRRFLIAVAPDGSGLREFYATHEDLGRPQWLPDGGSVLIPVREASLGERGQIWTVEFPSGRAQRVTKDQRDYNILWFDVDESAQSLVGVETTFAGDLWALENGDPASARQLTTAGSLVVYVSTFGKDKILYETREGHIYTADADGGNPKELKIGEQKMRDIVACGDGKHIIYAELSGEATDIWRADSDGSNAVQLTHEKSASMPNCSPDGQWIFYWNEEQRCLYRMAIDGSAATKVNLANASDAYVRISPDGKSLIYTAESSGHSKTEYNVVIAPVEGGKPKASFPMVPGMGMAAPQWSADGQSLYFNLMQKGAANIWKMEGPGGELKQVTNFPNGLIASYAWSRDGKTLYVARGTRSSDVVLLKAAK
jgi:Tol biopolymer transport system component